MLPKNEPTAIDVTPKNYLIWGESMSGKTYLACQFPNPILLNTDGNGSKVSTPSILIKDYQTFCSVISELEKGGHDFETIIIDLVDDIKLMVERYVLETYQLKFLTDECNRGYGESNKLWLRLMSKLSQLPQNIIFISHILLATSKKDVDKPSLSQRQLNVCMGRCDISIKCIKKEFRYYQECERKRQNYTTDDIKNAQILNILKNIKNLIEK